MASLPLRVPFRRGSPFGGPPPAYAHPGDAGLDLRAAVEEPVEVQAQGRVTIDTGWALEIPAGCVGLVLPRSGLLRYYGVGAMPGVIDQTYRGSIGVTLLNHSAEPYEVQPGDRIAQLVVVPVATVQPVEVEELERTERGTGGFGSTGR